jgi:hypothetical protein
MINYSKYIKTNLRKRYFLHLLIISHLSFSLSSFAQKFWSLEILLGDVYVFKTPLIIKQTGFEELNFNAKYHTHSFEMPFYYSIKLAVWNKHRAWELELLHLKLYLSNRPPEVTSFSITHGYNLLFINRLWEMKYLNLRLGGGIIVGHPENTIRGKKLNEKKGIFKSGYYISGVAVQLGPEKTFPLFKGLYLKLEGKLCTAYARVPLVDGHANVPNISIHGLFGFKYNL